MGPTYSDHDLDAIVAHATSRGIRVVPEVDVPGHAYRLVLFHRSLERGLQCEHDPEIYN